VRLGGRIYADALLRTSGKTGLRDAWRLGAASMPAHPVLAPPAQAAAGEGLDATSQQRHAEEWQDKACARIPH
jgi:hypothetical protein